MVVVGELISSGQRREARRWWRKSLWQVRDWSLKIGIEVMERSLGIRLGIGNGIGRFLVLDLVRLHVAPTCSIPSTKLTRFIIGPNCKYFNMLRTLVI